MSRFSQKIGKTSNYWALRWPNLYTSRELSFAIETFDPLHTNRYPDAYPKESILNALPVLKIQLN